jgi:formylglycine-generating enzyme required for sulfatase activity
MKPMRRRVAALGALLALLFLACLSGAAVAAADTSASGGKHASGVAFSDCPHCPEMVVVPGGDFTMTAKSGIDGRKDDDPENRKVTAPARPASVRTFAAAVYDVTRDEYAAFAAETGRSVLGGCLTWTGDQWTKSLNRDWRDPGFQQTGRDPVVCVSLDDAQAYVKWLNDRLSSGRPRGPARGGLYRLPTWEEAEYASRGGSTTPYYWGTRVSRDRANYGADPCLPCNGAAEGADRWVHTSPVGSFPPNPFGLYDVIGNVWQWTQDCAQITPEGVKWGTGDPLESCALQVSYGGSWLADPRYLKTGEYIMQRTTLGNTQTGFRLVRDGE